jgi:sugar lactone lactonase YvrE
MNPELLFESKAALGECPVWEARSQTLFWLDILGRRVYAGSDLLVELDEPVGCLAPRKRGGFILTKRLSFWMFESDPAQLTLISSLAGEPSNNRFNDGKCDPRGRFLAGTMDLNEKDPIGSLYSLEEKSITRLLSGVTISNGMTWSPDYKTFYYIDTSTHEVRAFDYDLETGSIANSRVAVRAHEALGLPDGMTSDMHGNLWIAMWGGAQVIKWDPQTGRLLEQFPVPALNVSSCAFGGKNLDELYITTARKGLDEGSMKQYPLAGSVFRLRAKVDGMPAFEFEG